MKGSRCTSSCTERVHARGPAYVLVAVLIVVTLGAVLSYGFIASHMNAPIEAALDDAFQRAVQAAHTGATVAIREIKHAAMTTDPAVDTLEDIWHDHWGYDGAILSLSDYDASSMSITIVSRNRETATMTTTGVAGRTDR